jgi:hypothetical protein
MSRFSLFFGSVEVHITHMPISTTLEFQHIFGLTGTNLIVIKNKPISVIVITVGYFLYII